MIETPYGVGEAYGYKLFGKNGRSFRTKKFVQPFSITSADTLKIYDDVGSKTAQGESIAKKLDSITEALRELRRDLREVHVKLPTRRKHG